MPRGEASSTPASEDVRQLRRRAISTEAKAPDQHICPTCDKRFASAASLESHKKVHAMKQGTGEAPQKRRAVAPASAPETKRARVQQQKSASQQEGGSSTRSGAGFRRVIKCASCDETFEDHDEWLDHKRQCHPQDTPSSQDTTTESSPRVTRRSGGVSSAVSTPTTPSRQPRQTSPTVRVAEQQLTSPARSPPAVSPALSSGGPSRSRNTTLRFEEELINGSVQCRQCQQVFNNRRGLAAHVAQKHREELDVEQRSIEEEKLRKEDVFQRRRRDVSRLFHGGIPQMITPPSRQISILARRPIPSVLQRPGVMSVARPTAIITTTPGTQPVYPRRTTLEILTQPAPVVSPSKSQSMTTRAAAARDKSPTKPAAGKDDQSTGAYAEPADEPPSLEPAVRGRGRHHSADSDDDDGIDESAYEFSTEVTVAAVPAGQGADGSSRSLPHRGQKPGSRRQIPHIHGGASNEAEVDSFPCRFCKDRTFLTPYGLERHTKMSHPAYLEQVLEDIQKSQLDKARRAEMAAFGGGHPERLYIDEDDRTNYDRFHHMDGRHHIPGLGLAAQSASFMRKKYSAFGEKENEPTDDTGEILQMAREESAALVAGASFTENRIGIRTRRSNDIARAKYQSCDICGILINTEHPKALESHTKAHQKNQELRQELLRMYGAAWVERVTCRECNLVFKDEDKLEQHRRNVHVRRRHFLCRFCGDVFRNMRDLNAHKERRHGSFEGTGHRRTGEGTPTVPQRQGASHRSYDSTSSDLGAVGPEEFACRTVCEVCGVPMARPSNLIRHMKLAHNRTNFTATVETRGMPPFKIDVNEGQFMWGCCDEVFDDRHAFINHRRAAHGLTYGGGPKECEHCGLRFRNTNAYLQHLRTHRPRVCNICGENFGNSVVDLNAFRAHMIRHREQGYTIRLPPIEEELSTREQQELWRAINDEELDDGSEDEYSIFSESGVESDVEDDSASDEDDVPMDQMTCAVCEKKFSCVYGYSEHWKLHCRQPFREKLNLKTKPFNYKKRRTPTFHCGGCSKKFSRGKSWAVHNLTCSQRRRGVIPADEANTSVSGGSSKASSPSKRSPAKSPRRELRSRTPRSGVDSDSDSRAKEGVTTRKRGEVEESLKELEDQLEVRPSKKKFVPDYIEKAYVVEWDTTKAPSDNPYTCQNCNQGFGDFLGLIIHVKTHISHPISHSDDEEKEPEKGKQGKKGKSKTKATADLADIKEAKEEKVSVSVLRIRTSTAEALGKHSCQVCGRYFQEKKLLQVHMGEVHRPHKRHRCSTCRRRFWTATALHRHDRRRHNVSLRHQYCGVCGKKFSTAEALAAHESKHELLNSLYQCEDCSISFYGLQQLKDHFKQNHQGVTILSCPICARIYTDRKALKEHVDSDHSNVRTLCKVCNKAFSTPAEAHQHRRRVHLGEGKSSESCTLCGKKFFNKLHLAVHTWRHLSTKNHQCRICDVAFDDDESVRTHLEKKHAIDWLDSRDLIVHNSTVFGDAKGETTPAEERNFSCFVCGKKGNSKSAIRRHLKEGIHKRDKKKECTHCGMKFWKQSALAEHLNRRHRQLISAEQDKAEGVNVAETIPAEVAQLLMNQGQLQFVTGENVQMIVADDATAAAVMAAAGGDQDYQVLLLQNENGETVQFALGPRAQLELAQLQQAPQGDTQRAAAPTGIEGQPMEIDESNYQQFLNQ